MLQITCMLIVYVFMQPVKASSNKKMQLWNWITGVGYSRFCH